MRHLFMIAVAFVFLAASFILKKYRERILVFGVVVLCLLNGIYTYTKADSILEKRHPFNQTFYTPDYIESLEFPDAFLRLFLDGKKVYVKDDATSVEQCTSEGFYWQYAICHYHNMVHFLESVNAEVVPDMEMNSYVVDGDMKNDFEEVGYLNDLLRNTMMYSGIDNEIGNYLFYVWYYRDFTKPAKFYANAESLKDADEFVIIWQSQGDGYEEKATEDMYLMSRKYYEENFVKEPKLSSKR